MKHFYKGENLTVAAIAERSNRSRKSVAAYLRHGTLPQTHYPTGPKRYMLECRHGDESYCRHRGHCRVCGARVRYTNR